MRKIAMILFFFVTINSWSQNKEKLSFDSVKKELADFLYKKGEMNITQEKKYHDGLPTVIIVGVHNNITKGELINGVYAFSLSGTMAHGYFLMVDDSEYTILDISSRENLDTSIKLLLDFCEKYNYCEKIITDYVGRLTRVYYNINKWRGRRTDFNCTNEKGVVDTTNLP